MARRSFLIGSILGFAATSLFINAKKEKAKKSNVAPVQVANQSQIYSASSKNQPINDTLSEDKQSDN